MYHRYDRYRRYQSPQNPIFVVTRYDGVGGFESVAKIELVSSGIQREVHLVVVGRLGGDAHTEIPKRKPGRVLLKHIVTALARQGGVVKVVE